MDNLTFTAFDTETATNHSASICQIGFVVVREGQIINEKTYLIQPPGNEYEARHSCIHGIDSFRTKDKPLFPEVWENIKDEFINSLLVAHNVSFDINVLNSTLAYYNLSRPQCNCDCTYQLSGLKLKSLAESFGIIMTKHHDALSDAKACAQAYLLLKQGFKPNLTLIREHENSNPFAGHKLTGEILKPDLNVENILNPFYAKKVVFTGILQTLTRDEAAKRVKDLGADIDTGVSKRTDFVIVGQGAGPSKLKKIEDLNSSGFKIQIIIEDDFLNMIK